MKTGLITAVLLLTSFGMAQRSDTARDTRVGGARDGALDRSENSQNPELKSELKKLSKDLNISTFQLRKEFEASAKTYAQIALRQAQATSSQFSAQAPSGAGTPLVQRNRTSSPQPENLTSEQFAKAKRASVSQNLPLDQIVAETAGHQGNVDVGITAVQRRQFAPAKVNDQPNQPTAAPAQRPPQPPPPPQR